MKKSNIITVVLLVILICGCFFIYRMWNEDGRVPIGPGLSAEDITKSNEEIELNQNITEWVSAPKEGEYLQPEGFGVERELTDFTSNTVGEEESKSSGMASIQMDESSTGNRLDVLGQDRSVLEDIETNIDINEEGEYTSEINWSDYDISTSEYYVLLAIAGKIYEDELNTNAKGRYRVICRQPTIEQMEEANIPVLFDIDLEGYLVLYCDVITQDLQNEIEVEDMMMFTLYYEEDVLTFKN